MKKKRNKEIPRESDFISEERMIEIQAEAYYRAIKRIKDGEKNNNINSVGDTYKKKYKWYEKILFIFNIFLFPNISEVFLHCSLYPLLLLISFTGSICLYFKNH